MQQNRNRPYTYVDAGFNGFLRRSIGSLRTTQTLRDMSRVATPPSQLNFDNMQVSGNLGDTIEVGKILLDGATGDGRIDGRNNDGQAVWRLGDQEG